MAERDVYQIYAEAYGIVASGTQLTSGAYSHGVGGRFNLKETLAVSLAVQHVKNAKGLSSQADFLGEVGKLTGLAA
jgi:hypothetical protein